MFMCLLWPLGASRSDRTQWNGAPVKVQSGRPWVDFLNGSVSSFSSLTLTFLLSLFGCLSSSSGDWLSPQPVSSEPWLRAPPSPLAYHHPIAASCSMPTFRQPLLGPHHHYHPLLDHLPQSKFIQFFFFPRFHFKLCFVFFCGTDDYSGGGFIKWRTSGAMH